MRPTGWLAWALLATLTGYNTWQIHQSPAAAARPLPRVSPPVTLPVVGELDARLERARAALKRGDLTGAAAEVEAAQREWDERVGSLRSDAKQAWQGWSDTLRDARQQAERVVTDRDQRPPTAP